MNLEPNYHGEPALVVTNREALSAAAQPELAARPPQFRSGTAARSGVATTLSLTSILKALYRRQVLALEVAFAAAIIAGLAAWLLVPAAKYKAQARLQVASQAPKVLFRTVETESNDDYKRYQNTQKTLVTSQLSLNAALQDAEVRNYRMVKREIDPIAWLQANLKVEFIAGSEVMEISLSGEDPRELAGMVNGVTKAYIDEVVNFDIKTRAERHRKLKKLKEQYAEMLNERRQNLRKLAQTVGSDDRQTLAYRQQIAMEHQAYVRRDLLEVQSQKRRLKAQQSGLNLDETSALSVSEAEINKWIDQDPTILQLVVKIARDEELLSATTSHLREASRTWYADPMQVRMKNDLAASRKLLKARRAELRPVAIRELTQNESLGQATRGDGIDRELAMLDNLEEGLQAEVEAISKGNQALTNDTLDLQSLQDEVAQMQESAQRVGSELEALTVELGAPSRIRIIEDAVPPRVKDDKKRWTILGLITVGGFFGGLFGIALFELQSQKVDSAAEVTTDLGLRVVGTLPLVKSIADRGVTATPRDSEEARNVQYLMLESIAATRIMLLHSARARSFQVVMITSAAAGEGKTTLASHLAASLAASGVRTMLIDADLRMPSLQRLFDLPLAPGLCEVLRGELEWIDAVAAMPIANLSVLTAGRLDSQALHLLPQNGLGPLFGQIKELFDFVIVDTSPILPVSDGLIFAQHVDAVLFSVFGDVSRKTKIADALERLSHLGVPILGAVVTGVHSGQYGYGYYAESGYRSLPASDADSSGKGQPA